MKLPPESLEKWVHETLHTLPERSAPASLEMRVLSEIARRENLPWWKRSWSSWPQSIKLVFVLISAPLCGVAIATGLGAFHLGAGAKVHELVAGQAEPFIALKSAVLILITTVGDLFRLVPSGWIYGIVGGVGLLYATILGVGATAYRALWKAA